MAAYNKVEVSLNTNAVEVGIPSPQAVNVTIPTVGPAGPTGPQGPKGDPGEVSGSIAWDNVTDKPATFTPSAHTHELADLDSSGIAAGKFLQADGNDGAQWADVADFNVPITAATASGFVNGNGVYYSTDVTLNSRNVFKLNKTYGMFFEASKWHIFENVPITANILHSSNTTSATYPWQAAWADGDVDQGLLADAVSDVADQFVFVGDNIPSSRVTDLATVATSGDYDDLTNKPSTFTPSAHASLHEGDAADPVVLTRYVQIQDAVLDDPAAFKADVLYAYDDLIDVPTNFPPSSHTHGNLTNDGKIGTTSGLPLKTGTNGVVEAGAFGTSAGEFCEGNDARLSDLHAQSHAITSTSDHTAGNWKVFHSNGSGEIVELALGDSGKVLQSNGATSAPTWETPSGGGATNLWIPASAWIPKTTAGCGVDSRETSTNDQNFDELLFDAGSDEFADALVVMPSNYNNGTITARFYWTAASGSGGVAWAIQGRAFANDDALDTAAGTAQLVTDTLIAANDMHVTSATSAVTIGGTPAANTPIQFSIYRDVSDAADDLAVDARLLGVEIIFN
jgi:hypothetical protein